MMSEYIFAIVKRKITEFFLVTLCMIFIPLVVNAGMGPAKDGPGQDPNWAPSNKSFIGTSISKNSLVYFTGYRSAVTEVFFPVLDTPNQSDLGLLIQDPQSHKIISDRDLPFRTKLIDPKALAWEVISESTDLNLKITKRIFTDPDRHALIMRYALTPLLPNTTEFKPLNLFLVRNPAIGNSGLGDTGETIVSLGKSLMVAYQGNLPEHGTIASAIGISTAWRKNARSEDFVTNGFQGRPSDGIEDLKKNGAMTQNFDLASDGNITQMGHIDLKGRSNELFDVVMAFASDNSPTGVDNAKKAAVLTVNDVLASDLNALQARYIAGWKNYTGSLDTQKGTADDQYYLSAMILKTSQDKKTGIMVAGPGKPWGPSRSDTVDIFKRKQPDGGYHLVWTRDLFKFSNALITAGDVQTAVEASNYMLDRLMQTQDCGDIEYGPGTDADCMGAMGKSDTGFSRKGRFQQTTWLNGYRYFQGTQMDEAAMPIILAWRIYQQGNAAQKLEVSSRYAAIKTIADYLLNNSARVDGLKKESGPWTHQERWEEVSGFSPSTLAAEIAGLVCAADLAIINGDKVNAARYLKAADQWQQLLNRWTFTTNGPLKDRGIGNGRYFLRISENKDPNSADSKTYGNGGGAHDERDIVDGGFLELVRLGVRRALSDDILDTIPEYDAVLKQTIGGDEAWFRYNFDGYGETNAGENYTDDAANNKKIARGRLWPIFTAERGMYEIAAAGSGAAGSKYLPMLKRFANSSGFIPEQIWNTPITFRDKDGKTWDTNLPPGGVLPDTPPDEKAIAGKPTKSMAPLNWAMGEYINLLASIAANRVVDIPAVVCDRYNACLRDLASGAARLDITAMGDAGFGWNVYVAGNIPELGDWDTDLAIPAEFFTGNNWKNVINVPGSKAIEYKYFRKNSDTGVVKWEDRMGNRTFTTPTAGATSTINDTITGWEP